MDRVQKQEQIDFLKGVFSDAESVVVASVKGMDAASAAELRKNAHEKGVLFKVVKNRLAKIAAKGTPIEILGEDFVGSTALAWSKEDPVSPAKVLVDFQKKNENFEIRSAFNAAKRLEIADIKVLASMPSLEELKSQILGLMEAVPAKLLAQLNAPAQNVVMVIQAKHDKDKEEGAEA